MLFSLLIVSKTMIKINKKKMILLQKKNLAFFGLLTNTVIINDDYKEVLKAF